MTVELTTTNVISILALFVMALWAMAKVIAHVYDKRFTERFLQTETRLAELEGGLARSDSRLSKVEGALEDAPGHEDLEKIYERINRVAEQMNGLAGEFTEARHTLRLLHQFLLQGGRP
ncbi:hypothetical protein [Delftia sp. HK171]|uniref:hypothetical protein n=1 Tax=Delftia sp. HK171 TaxID=1920191 RepID=UPI001150F64D|nr:hypothetical protein [Delftia sp. HK171]TQL73073.1 hypothetical protein FB549_3815 [Delftia sp. HK171]